MHDLENLNIPIIGCLMEDIAMSLDAQQQATVARWAIKTAMVQDAIYTRTRSLFYNESERIAVKADSALPSDTIVWLGRSSLRTLSMDGFDLGLDFCGRNDEVPEPARSCVSTFVVGHLAIQILSIHVPEKYSGRPWEVRCPVAGPWDQLLIPIWPINIPAINWPPSLYFREKGIDKLNKRLKGGRRVLL